MQTFKRLSAATAAANGGAYLTIRIGGKVLYVVPDDGQTLKALDSVEIVGPLNDRGNREITGHIGFGHLDRLGNGNRAAAAIGEWRMGTAFSIEARRGLGHNFQDPAETSAFHDNKDAFLAGSRGAFFATPDLAKGFEAARLYSPGTGAAAAMTLANVHHFRKADQ